MAQSGPPGSGQSRPDQPQQLEPGPDQLTQPSPAASAPQQPQQPQPSATDLNLAALKAEHPEVAWDEPLIPLGQLRATTVGEYVPKHMRQIWGFLKSDNTLAPKELVVYMAQAGLEDRHMPYNPYRLQQLLPKVPTLFLENFDSCQRKALAIPFAPKQHRVVTLNDTVPFIETRSKQVGASGTIIKVKEAEQVYAMKRGPVELLTPELDVLSKLPERLHNVHLRASYELYEYMYLITSPWADTDLGAFMARPEVLPVWLSATKQQRGALLVNWMNCLSVGLADLHCHGIKHKGINPSSILLASVSSEGLEVHPVFCDFGLSKPLPQQSGSAGQGGTMFYQAPEQLAGQPAGRKADVFSLGCVLLELAMMAAGKQRSRLGKQLAITGFASSELVMDGTFVQCLPSDSDWWVGMRGLLLRMLDKEPQQRPHADEVARIIHNLASTAGYELSCRHQHPHPYASASTPGSPSDPGSSDGERWV